VYSNEKIKISKAEFYITNVCNLNCSRCNRFNDHAFKGWQKWSDYEQAYKNWSEKIQIDQVVILGGEPLLNPSICEWIAGINSAFQKGVQVLTNGTRLNKTPGFYEAIQHCSVPGETNWIGISVHNSNELEWYLNEVKTFLKGELHWQDSNNAGADYFVRDQNGVGVGVWLQDHFTNAAVHRLSNGQLGLYNNDPIEAHKVCCFAQFKNYHFIRGELYKCGPVALFPEFDQQFALDLSESDRELINSYHPLSIDEFDDLGVKFLSEIDNPISQCKFCPRNTDISQEKIIAIQKNQLKNQPVVDQLSFGIDAKQ
jgi:organic radical activating enzyme